MKTFSLSGRLGNWITDSKPSSFEDADIVLLPGGSDVDPALYGHEAIKGTYINKESDSIEMELLNKAIEANKFVIGICKGSQMLTARAGGWLIQDVTSHGGFHNIVTVDGDKLVVNSSHHQMCFPYDMPSEDYQLLAWAEQLSARHLIQGYKDLFDTPKEAHKPELFTEDGSFKEPEVIWYPKIRGLAIQSHPEWASSPKAFNLWANTLVNKYINI